MTGMERVAGLLKEVGYIEFPKSLVSTCDRNFYRRLSTDIVCDLNQRLNMITYVWGPIRHAVGVSEGSVEFEICGEKSGRWFKLLSYSHAPTEITKENLLATEQILLAGWLAMAHAST